VNDKEMTKLEAYMDARYAADMLAEAIMQLDKGNLDESRAYMRKALDKVLEDFQQWEREHGISQ
jgi:hypothetical protein